MPVAFVILLLGLLFFAGSSANANDRTKISGDHETRASDRVDIRYRYRNLPKDKDTTKSPLDPILPIILTLICF